MERKYVGSIEAVASLHEGACEIAGFHIPQGEFEETGFKHYSRWLIPKQSRIIHVATRRQGFMVASGNPHKIYEVQDLTRKGLRFVNRQPSSGTRFLLECFLKKAHVDTSQIAGYEQAEFTHAAVAAYVASGMADVGFGVETPLGWWVFTGDTGPNPALWQALNGQRIAQLVIETAFGDEEAHLAMISGHLAPQTLARELAQLDGEVSVYITHPKPGEVPAVLSQIRALDTRHVIEPLREGQRFHVPVEG